MIETSSLKMKEISFWVRLVGRMDGNGGAVGDPSAR